MLFTGFLVVFFLDLNDKNISTTSKMASKLFVFWTLVVLACISTTVTGQGPVILQQIPNQSVSSSNPLNELINLRADFSHPNPEENLILTVQQSNGSPLPEGITLSLKPPTLVGSGNTPDIARGVFVVGSLAYVGDGGSGLQIIDVSNPAAPTLAGSYNTPDHAQGVFVVGSLAYVADDNVGGLQIIDVSNPAIPTLVGNYNTPGYAWSVFVVGSLAYVADEGSGLQIIDVSNPAAPTRVGSYNTPGAALGAFVVGSLAYVANIDDLQILDVSNPAAPTLVGSYNTPGEAYGVFVVGSLAYVADYYSGLQIIDVSNPAAPTLAGSYNTPGYAYGVFVVGSLAYVADYDSGLQILDVSNPAAPVLAGTYNTPGGAQDVFVVGNLAYVADYYPGLQIIDVSQWQLVGVPTIQDSYTLTVNVEDSQGLFAAYNFTLSELLLTNPLLDQTGAVNVAFNYVVPSDTFTDPSDPILDYSAQSAGGGALPGWLTFTTGTRTFSGTPLPGTQGNYNIEVIATNDIGSSASDVFVLTVANRNPVQDNALANQALDVGATLNYAFAANTFSDGDGDPLTYTAEQSGGGALPSWLSFTSGTRAFSAVPVSGDQGLLRINVTTSDGFGGSVTGTFTITVNNKAPILQTPLSDSDAFFNVPFGRTVPIDTFLDPDGDALTYTATLLGDVVLPPWLSFTSATRIFSGTPTPADGGQYTIEVTGDDGFTGLMSTTFVIRVAAVGSGNNSPLVAVTIPDQTAGTDALWTFTVPPNTFEDPDDDPLTYVATLEGGASLPGWLTFDDQTQAFSGVPTTIEVIRITVRVDDGQGGFALDTFTVTIQDTTNQPPVLLNQLPNQNVNVGSNFRYTVPADTFTDPNGDVLIYTAARTNRKPLPNWLKFDAPTRTFSGKPSNKDTKTYADRIHTIEVCVSDQEGNACSSFTLAVVGESEIQQAITAILILASIASTLFAAYRNRATIWNWTCKRWYQLPRQAAVVDKAYTYSILIDEERIRHVQAFTCKGKALKANKLLPGWLDYQNDNKLVGTPGKDDITTLIIRVLSDNQRILAEFELGIFETETEAQEYEREGARASGRSKRDIMMQVFSKRDNSHMQKHLLAADGSSIEQA